MTLLDKTTLGQTNVHVQPAPAMAGDFASSNPRANYPAGPGALVVGPDGVIVGRFGWIGEDDGLVYNHGEGPPHGFIHREQQALIDVYLDSASLMVPRGFGITLMIAGDYWALNEGEDALQPGGKVKVDFATGKVGTGTEIEGWVYRTAAEPGELAKISSYLLPSDSAPGAAP